MKKIILSLTRLVTISITIFLTFTSCQKEKSKRSELESVPPKMALMSDSMTLQELTEAIRNDSITHEFVREWTINSFNESNPSSIQDIISDGEVSVDEQVSLANAMGYDNFNDYSNYVSSIDSMVIYLNQTYGFNRLSENERIDIVFPIAETYMLQELINRGMVVYSGSSQGCAESLAFCAASVTTAAMAGHAACVAADVTVIVGILCHASVIALQIIGNQECIGSYHDCINAL